VKALALSLIVTAAALSSAQFVYPKPEYNVHDPSVYKEDPFIVEYRHKFFSVFRGDFKTFDTAFTEIKGMVAKNPNDARALVWEGNGETIQATLDYVSGKKDQVEPLIESSRKTLDAAVRLRPDDPNIYMMRVATLYVQAQFLPPSFIPMSNWAKIASDCERFIRFIGPERIRKVSIHVRGEAYGELGLAREKLGDKAGARKAFEELIALNPNTDYETRARKEIAKL
jgi:tetratricopeptide (TPR) repeat protein